MNVAVAGLGFMGATHLKAWKQISRARVIAVVSSDEKKLAGDLTDVGGNLGGATEVMDFSGIRKYRSLNDALADRDIDAVDLCLPTDQHAKAAIAAFQAGKHVLVEKPMAMDEAEAESMIEQARHSGRTLMVGQVLRFFPAYVALADTLSTSSPVRSAVFRRRCGAPTWNRWLKDSSRSGGGAFDLLIHDSDYCISCWGMPRSVRAVGYEDLERGIDVVHAELTYPSVGSVIVTGGWHPGAYPFSMGFTVVTDRGTAEWSNGDAGLRDYITDGEVAIRKLSDRDAFADELQYFTDCVIGGRTPERCKPEQSAQAVALMRRIIESRRRNGEVIRCHN